MTLAGCVMPDMVSPAEKINPAANEIKSSAVFRLKNGAAPISAPVTAVDVFIVLLARGKYDMPRFSAERATAILRKVTLPTTSLVASVSQ